MFVECATTAPRYFTPSTTLRPVQSPSNVSNKSLFHTFQSKVIATKGTKFLGAFCGYEIFIGNGRKQRANTINVTIAITMRFVPRGSITAGCGCGTFIITANNTA